MNEESKNSEIEVTASGDAIVIADAINNLADAIRTHARALSMGEELSGDEPKYL